LIRQPLQLLQRTPGVLGRGRIAALDPACDELVLVEPQNYQGESWVLDPPESVCARQAWSEHPATSVLFSIPDRASSREAPQSISRE
jgi:hypothetical protein